MFRSIIHLNIIFQKIFKKKPNIFIAVIYSTLRDKQIIPVIYGPFFVLFCRLRMCMICPESHSCDTRIKGYIYAP